MAGTPRIEQDSTVLDYLPGQPVPVLIRDPRTGKMVVNPLKKYVVPYTLVTEPAVITLAANEVANIIPMTLDGQAAFEVFYGTFVSQQSAAFTVKIFDPDNRPVLSNRELHVATIASGAGVSTSLEGALGTAGSAGRAFRWPETLWVNTKEGGKALMVEFRNLSSVQNTIRFALHGLRWNYLQAPTRVADRMKEIYHNRFRTMPYFYTTDQFATLAGSASGEFEIRMGDEAWSEWKKAMAISTGRFNIRIREKVSGRRLMPEQIRDDLVFGNGELPFLCWESSLFEPGMKLVMEATDLSGSTNDIWFTLGCRKIFWDPKEDRFARP